MQPRIKCSLRYSIKHKKTSQELFAQSTGVVEYTDCNDPANESPGYDTKQSDGEVPVMLELWGMRSTPSLPLLAGPLWPGMVAPDKGPRLNRTKLHTYAKLNCLK